LPSLSRGKTAGVNKSRIEALIVPCSAVGRRLQCAHCFTDLTRQEIHMNKPAEFKFSSVDTVMSTALVSVMAVGCAVLLMTQGIQAVVA